MLYSFDTGKYVKDIPHREEFDIYRSRLTESQYQAILDELNSRVDTDEIHTSSWMPGADWTGTVFQPIYDVACRKDVDASAKFFGLILWQI